MPFNSFEMVRIEYHRRLIQNLSVRQDLFKQFVPTFFFHKEEDNFPVNPEDYIKNIITVKRDEYLHIQERHHRNLTEIEQLELASIERFFWRDGHFNDNYKTYQNHPDFIKLTARADGDPIPTFLIFDEKHYGYQVGEKIDVVGIAPKGHRNYDESREMAPLSASIIPTRKGFFIQYQYLYSLNNAINGTQWLRKWLPEWLCKKVDDFGFHYGDAEGVGIHVSVEADGSISLQSMQTWAHGRGYAQHLASKDCTFDENGNICVFIGVGGHPAYAHNFVGRNSAMDLVGDTYKIEPTQFIDVSEDMLKLARDPELLQSTHALANSARMIPGSLSAFTRFADSNPLAYHGIKSEQQWIDNFSPFNRYSPWLFFARIRDFFKSLFYKKHEMRASRYSILMATEDPVKLAQPDNKQASSDNDALSERQCSSVPPQPVSIVSCPDMMFYQKDKHPSPQDECQPLGRIKYEGIP